MLRSIIRIAVVVGALLTCLGRTTASAQVFPTFSWQMQPYCNVVTLTLKSTPAGFTLDGTDDQCGATNKASAFGVASFNAVGSVTISMTIVSAPGGKAVHVSAVVSPANGHGTWTDSVGNTGTFALFGAVPGLPVRPFPASGLGASTVTAAELAPGAVGASQLAPSAVGASQLAPNAVTGASVVDGSLSSAELRDGPRASFADGNQTRTSVGQTPLVLRSLTMTVPAAGRVIVNGSVGALLASATATDAGECSLGSGTTIESERWTAFGETSSSTPLFFPIALTRGFDVPAGTFAVNLVCQMGAGSAIFLNSSLTAMFFPQ